MRHSSCHGVCLRVPGTLCQTAQADCWYVQAGTQLACLPTQRPSPGRCLPSLRRHGLDEAGSVSGWCRDTAASLPSCMTANQQYPVLK